MKKLEDGFKKIAEEMPRVTESEAEMVWKPLRAVVPEKWRNGFMFMGKYDYLVKTPQAKATVKDIHDYKHGITRKYLHISPKNSCYCNIGYDKEAEKILLKSCSCDEAMDSVYENIETFGATRETVFDEKYKDKRNKALAEQAQLRFEKYRK